MCVEAYIKVRSRHRPNNYHPKKVSIHHLLFEVLVFTRRQIHQVVTRVDRVVAALGVAVGDEVAGRLVGEAVRARWEGELVGAVVLAARLGRDCCELVEEEIGRWLGRENEEVVVGRFGEGRGLAKKREELVSWARADWCVCNKVGYSLILDSEHKNNLSVFFLLSNIQNSEWPRMF